MPGFKYFLPHATAAQIAPGDRLDEFVLPDILSRPLADLERSGRDFALSTVDRGGPGGHPGLVLTVRTVRGDDDNVSQQYRPLQQSWLEAADGSCFIGWEKDAPPQPEDLARRRQVPGYQIADEAGGQWQVPIARAPDRPYGALPQSYTFNGQGPVGHLKREFRELWTLAGDLWRYYAWHFGREAIESGEAISPGELPPQWLQPAWLLEKAVWILGVNYRVGALEINALFEAERPLLDDQFKHAACQAVCDFDFTLELVQKKTPASSSSGPASAGLSSTPGDGADSPAIGPASGGSGSPNS